MQTKSEWRAALLQLCGPGVLAGITLGTWLKLLRTRGSSLAIRRGPRVLSISLQSLKNSFWSGLEKRRYNSRVQSVDVLPPLFILGHWRSGTTWLHEILARDQRFGYPNSYQVSFPHTFLTTEKFSARLMAPFLPRRRPMDGMEMRFSSPQEDEFAICSTTLQSPCLGWVFPHQKHEFAKYLTLESLSKEELAEWQNTFLWFLRKVQLRCDRPLVLKSPPHTARIRHLLEWFPQAKFVHIRRDPYRVIQSSLHTFKVLHGWHTLQRYSLEDLDDWTLRQYAEMHRAFFEQQPGIPEGRFHEIAFEALEKDPVGEIARLYRALDLPDFREFEPSLRQYLNSVAGYKKNPFPEMPQELKLKIRKECRECFERWQYPG
jgi:omega-hydroxy-beta-dihydromenaquinone-9 sulfotransferase